MRSWLLEALFSVLKFLLGYTELLAIWAGIQVWDAFTGRPLSTETRWSLYIGALAAVSFWNWRREVQRADAAEAALAADGKKTKQVRVFAEEPEALLDRYAHKGMLADKLLVPYLDKWMTVSGRFEGIAESLLGNAIHLSLILQTGARIHLRFPAEARDRLRLVREGQQVTAVCQIQHGYGPGVFVLENSELTHVKPPRPALACVS
jgi:hypothetical protein